jgi:hypothetical protein
LGIAVIKRHTAIRSVWSTGGTFAYLVESINQNKEN